VVLAAGSCRDVAGEDGSHRAATDAVEVDHSTDRHESASQAAPQAAAPPPSPARPSVPWSPERLQGALESADAAMHELGAYRHADRTHRGPDGVTHPELSQAYAGGRAMNWRGTFTEIQEWTGLAKFGAKRPGGDLARGPLAGWNLTVITQGPRAYLHAWLGPNGPSDGIGRHERLDGDTRWIALCDVLEPGAEYLPYKRDHSESLHHQWGRADVIEDLASLARAYHQTSGVPLGIGDISHVTGGKLRGHWTHQLGVDVDVYLLSFPDREHDTLGAPVNFIFTYRRGENVWSTRRDGRGRRETPREDGTVASERRLRILAELALPNDAIAYFVHDADSVLEPFDAQAQQRRVGRRYLHRRNQGFWPHHPDHVHLRWVPLERALPGGTPRP